MTKPRLIVIGPLPPPVHGVTVSTGLVLSNRALHQRFMVFHLDTSDHYRDRRNVGHWDVRNVVLGLASLGRLVALRGPRGIVYLPLSQGVGAFLRDSLYIWAASTMRWRVALHLRGSEILDLYQGQGWPFRCWARATLRRVASAAVMGESLRGVFGKLVPPDRVRVVPNGTPRITTKGVQRDRNQILFLSSLRRRKGVVEAVEAAAITVRRIPQARFIFVGEWEDADLERQLRLRAMSAGGESSFANKCQARPKTHCSPRPGCCSFHPAAQRDIHVSSSRRSRPDCLWSPQTVVRSQRRSRMASPASWFRSHGPRCSQTGWLACSRTTISITRCRRQQPLRTRSGSRRTQPIISSPNGSLTLRCGRSSVIDRLRSHVAGRLDPQRVASFATRQSWD